MPDQQISRLARDRFDLQSLQIGPPRMAILRLRLDPFVERSVKAWHALEPPLVLCRISQVQHALHSKGYRIGRVHIPVDKTYDRLS